MSSNAMMWVLRMSIVVAMSVALVSCGRRSPSHVVGGGGYGGSADLWISGGHQFLYEGKPGVVFGMVKPRGQSRRFSYVLVFKHDFPNGSYSAPSNTSTAGDVGDVSQSLELNGRKVQLSYRIDLGDESSSEPSETLIVNDKTVPIADGIVFLIDFDRDPSDIKQTKVELPDDLPDPARDTSVVEQLAAQILDTLRKHDPALRDFLEN